VSSWTEARAVEMRNDQQFFNVALLSFFGLSFSLCVEVFLIHLPLLLLTKKTIVDQVIFSFFPIPPLHLYSLQTIDSSSSSKLFVKEIGFFLGRRKTSSAVLVNFHSSS